MRWRRRQRAPQRITVTGSSIKRIAAEGALPVQTISAAELTRQGIVNAEQLIATLTSNGNGLDNLASNSDVVSGQARGNNGATSANLRGQGSNATLILLNGRRIAAHGLNGGTVDLNQIPMAAVERVEVLKDGASSIYGTDAIGGVINFILRTNFQGLRAAASIDVTEAGGGNIYARLAGRRLGQPRHRRLQRAGHAVGDREPSAWTAASATSSTASSPNAACRPTRAARPSPRCSPSTRQPPPPTARNALPHHRRERRHRHDQQRPGAA